MPCLNKVHALVDHKLISSSRLPDLMHVRLYARSSHLQSLRLGQKLRAEHCVSPTSFLCRTLSSFRDEVDTMLHPTVPQVLSHKVPMCNRTALPAKLLREKLSCITLSLFFFVTLLHSVCLCWGELCSGLGWGFCNPGALKKDLSPLIL